MKKYFHLKVFVLLILPIALFFFLNKYFYGTFALFGQSTPDLQVLDSVQSVEGVLPIHFFKNEKKLKLGVWYEKIASQEALVGKELRVSTMNEYPTHIAQKVKAHNFQLKYQKISEEDFNYVNDYYFVNSPYLIKKMDNASYPTSEHASGTMYVFRGINNDKIYGIEMDSETENDFGTHETMIFQKDQILYQHVHNMARDVDANPVIMFLATGLFILGEIVFVIKTQKKTVKK